jgi:hypothetical protein
MDYCLECGEDLGQTWNEISICENKKCDKYHKKNSIDKIDHLEGQILLNEQMNNS